MWSWRNIPEHQWSFLSLLYLLAGPALLFVAVALLLPSVPDDKN